MLLVEDGLTMLNARFLAGIISNHQNHDCMFASLESPTFISFYPNLLMSYFCTKENFWVDASFTPANSCIFPRYHATEINLLVNRCQLMFVTMSSYVICTIPYFWTLRVSRIFRSSSPAHGRATAAASEHRICSTSG